MINVWIDECTPCLRNTQSGDLVETEIVQVTRKSYLARFNKKSRWYVNWSSLIPEYEVYALVIKGTTYVQGLVALKKDENSQTVYVAWMCASPENNRNLTNTPRYSGVGGHLFAICVDKSCEYGFGGAIMGFAANEKLLTHYCETFNATYIGILH